MPSPGFSDPAVASIPPAGNLYFADDLAASATIPSSQIYASTLVGPGTSEAATGRLHTVSLMFGGGTATTPEGAPIVNAAESSRGHISDVLNFHGSPAPWVLIGILIVAGLLHLSAGASGKVQL